ncbi:hypothetical protein Ahy_A01g000062 [Arachis hypogaea]|uniref:FAR1 domain-containing protein n=1 Tax=Arachis hypogaea TaxID=3818 RepID=A0A445EJ86_ARAHY|nr:hypothetical protein Ahy_A01g000062 [Arachis hypogaea]
MSYRYDSLESMYANITSKVIGQKFFHEKVNSEHISYDQYEQEEEKHEEVEVDYMNEDDTNVEPMFDYHGFDEGYNIDSLEDIRMIEFWNIRDEDVCHFHFFDVDIAFEFYNRYARPRGFNPQKNRTRKSRAGVLKLKNFVCHREGFRPQNNYGIEKFKKKPTPETRCGCSAIIEIRLDAPNGRWFISYFFYKHNHSLLDPRLNGLLRGHRFMSEADIGHMINMKKGGISVGKIYRILANQAVYILVHEDIDELPRSLVLSRWTKTAKEEYAAQKELVNDVDNVRDYVQLNASGPGLATNDLGHSMLKDPRKFRTKGGATQSNKRKHRCGQCGMEGHNRTTCHIHRDILQLEGSGIDTFDNDLDDHMNIEDNSLVYDENASYSSNEVL